MVLKLLSNYFIVIFDDNIQNSSACEVIKDETKMYDKIKYEKNRGFAGESTVLTD